mmetsp:Transcript_786/g.1040  ORF Transcript_786/g.1040 Transcript_786/m.1040 type:complete len:145 (+) Transcript_786:108-542(+)
MSVLAAASRLQNCTIRSTVPRAFLTQQVTFRSSPSLSASTETPTSKPVKVSLFNLAKTTIHEKHGLTTVQSKEIVDTILESIAKSILEGNSFYLNGIGTLCTRTAKARKGRNPSTGEELDIPEKRRVKFTVSKTLKDKLHGEDN